MSGTIVQGRNIPVQKDQSAQLPATEQRREQKESLKLTPDLKRIEREYQAPWDLQLMVGNVACYADANHQKENLAQHLALDSAGRMAEVHQPLLKAFKIVRFVGEDRVPGNEERLPLVRTALPPKEGQPEKESRPRVQSAVIQAEELFALADGFSAKGQAALFDQFERLIYHYEKLGLVSAANDYLDRFKQRLAQLIREKHGAPDYAGDKQKYRVLDDRSKMSSEDVIRWYTGYGSDPEQGKDQQAGIERIRSRHGLTIDEPGKDSGVIGLVEIDHKPCALHVVVNSDSSILSLQFKPGEVTAATSPRFKDLISSQESAGTKEYISEQSKKFAVLSSFVSDKKIHLLPITLDRFVETTSNYYTKKIEQGAYLDPSEYREAEAKFPRWFAGQVVEELARSKDSPRVHAVQGTLTPEKKQELAVEAAEYCEAKIDQELAKTKFWPADWPFPYQEPDSKRTGVFIDSRARVIAEVFALAPSDKLDQQLKTLFESLPIDPALSAEKKQEALNWFKGKLLESIKEKSEHLHHWIVSREKEPKEQNKPTTKAEEGGPQQRGEEIAVKTAVAPVRQRAKEIHSVYGNYICYSSSEHGLDGVACGIEINGIVPIVKTASDSRLYGYARNLDRREILDLSKARLFHDRPDLFSDQDPKAVVAELAKEEQLSLPWFNEVPLQQLRPIKINDPTKQPGSDPGERPELYTLKDGRKIPYDLARSVLVEDSKEAFELRELLGISREPFKTGKSVTPKLVDAKEQAEHLFSQLERLSSAKGDKRPSDRAILLANFSELLKEYRREDAEKYRADVFKNLANLILYSYAVGKTGSVAEVNDPLAIDGVIGDYIGAARSLLPAQTAYPSIDQYQSIAGNYFRYKELSSTASLGEESKVLGVYAEPSANAVPGRYGEASIFDLLDGREPIGNRAFVVAHRDRDGRESIVLSGLGGEWSGLPTEMGLTAKEWLFYLNEGYQNERGYNSELYPLKGTARGDKDDSGLFVDGVLRFSPTNAYRIGTLLNRRTDPSYAGLAEPFSLLAKQTPRHMWSKLYYSYIEQASMDGAVEESFRDLRERHDSDRRSNFHALSYLSPKVSWGGDDWYYNPSAATNIMSQKNLSDAPYLLGAGMLAQGWAPLSYDPCPRERPVNRFAVQSWFWDEKLRELEKKDPEVYRVLKSGNDTLAAFTAREIGDPIKARAEGDQLGVQKAQNYFDYDMHKLAQFLEQYGYSHMHDVKKRRELVKAAFLAHVHQLRSSVVEDLPVEPCIEKVFGPSWQTLVPFADNLYLRNGKELGLTQEEQKERAVAYALPNEQSFVAGLIESMDRLYPDIKRDLVSVLPDQVYSPVQFGNPNEVATAEREQVYLADAKGLIAHLKECPDQQLVKEMKTYLEARTTPYFAFEKWRMVYDDYAAQKMFGLAPEHYENVGTEQPPFLSEELTFLGACFAAKQAKEYSNNLLGNTLRYVKQIDPCTYERIGAVVKEQMLQTIASERDRLSKQREDLKGKELEQCKEKIVALDETARFLEALKATGAKEAVDPIEALDHWKSGGSVGLREAFLEPLRSINPEIVPRLAEILAVDNNEFGQVFEERYHILQQSVQVDKIKKIDEELEGLRAQLKMSPNEETELRVYQLTCLRVQEELTLLGIAVKDYNSLVSQSKAVGRLLDDINQQQNSLVSQRKELQGQIAYAESNSIEASALDSLRSRVVAVDDQIRRLDVVVEPWKKELAVVGQRTHDEIESADLKYRDRKRQTYQEIEEWAGSLIKQIASCTDMNKLEILGQRLAGINEFYGRLKSLDPSATPTEVAQEVSRTIDNLIKQTRAEYQSDPAVREARLRIFSTAVTELNKFSTDRTSMNNEGKKQDPVEMAELSGLRDPLGTSRFWQEMVRLPDHRSKEGDEVRSRLKSVSARELREEFASAAERGIEQRKNSEKALLVELLQIEEDLIDIETIRSRLVADKISRAELQAELTRDFSGDGDRDKYARRSAYLSLIESKPQEPASRILAQANSLLYGDDQRKQSFVEWAGYVIQVRNIVNSARPEELTTDSVSELKSKHPALSEALSWFAQKPLLDKLINLESERFIRYYQDSGSYSDDIGTVWERFSEDVTNIYSYQQKKDAYSNREKKDERWLTGRESAYPAWLGAEIGQQLLKAENDEQKHRYGVELMLAHPGSFFSVKGLGYFEEPTAQRDHYLSILASAYQQRQHDFSKICEELKGGADSAELKARLVSEGKRELVSLVDLAVSSKEGEEMAVLFYNFLMQLNAPSTDFYQAHRYDAAQHVARKLSFNQEVDDPVLSLLTRKQSVTRFPVAVQEGLVTLFANDQRLLFADEIPLHVLKKLKQEAPESFALIVEQTPKWLAQEQSKLQKHARECQEELSAAILKLQEYDSEYRSTGLNRKAELELLMSELKLAVGNGNRKFEIIQREMVLLKRWQSLFNSSLALVDQVGREQDSEKE